MESMIIKTEKKYRSTLNRTNQSASFLLLRPKDLVPIIGDKSRVSEK